MEQQPQGPPKGTVDLFGTLHDAAAHEGPAFDPLKYLYTMDRDQRQGKYTVAVDPQFIQQKFGQDPKYKDHPELLQEDIKTVQSMHKDMAASRAYAPYYRPPVNLTEALGVKTTPEMTNAEFVKDPYTFWSSTGGGKPYITGEQGAASREVFVDMFGRRRPITFGDLHGGRELYLSYETDPDGKLGQVPVLKELRAGETPYGKDMLNWRELQPLSRNPLKSLYTGFLNMASPVAGWMTSLMAETLGNETKSRMDSLYKAFNTYGAPVQGPSWEQGAATGLLGGGNGERGMTASSAYLAGQEPLNDLLEDFKSNEGLLRQAAKRGDQKAMVAVEMLDLHEGTKGQSALDRIAQRATMFQRMMEYTPSEREISQGPLGGAEGFLSMMGGQAAFFLPQATAATGLSELLLKTGSKAFVTRSLQAGMAPTLTKLGARTVAGLSSFVPATQMSLMVYQGAREAGYSSGDAARLAAVSFPAIMATEGIISTPWMIKSYVGAGGSNSLRSLVASTLGKEAATGNVSAQAGKVLANMWGWLQKGGTTATGNFAKNVSEGLLREGFQEGMEELYYATSEAIWDSVYGQKAGGRGNFGTDLSSQQTWDRILLNAEAGGVAGGVFAGAMGGQRHARQFDQSIAGAVAEGKSSALLTLVRKMTADGAMTTEEASAIQQDVALATDIMRGMNIIDPQYLGVITGQKDLSREYVEKGVEVKELQDQLTDVHAQMAAEGADKDALEKHVADLQGRLASAKGAQQEIMDGTRAMQRLKDTAIGLSAAVAKGKGDYQSGDLHDHTVVDAIATDLTTWVKNEQQMRTERATERKMLVAQLNKSIDQLLGAKAPALEKMLTEAEQTRSLMMQKGVLSREDAKRLLDTYNAKRQQMFKEILESEGKVEDPTGESDKPLTIGQQYAAYKNVTGNDDAEDFVMNIVGDQITSGEYKDAQKPFAALNRLREATLPFGESDEAQTATIQSLLSQEAMEERRPEELMDRYFTSLPTAGAERVRAEEILKWAAGKTTANSGELKRMGDAVKFLDMQLKAWDAMSDAYHGLAQRMQPSAMKDWAKSGDRGKMVPKAIADLLEMDKVAYGPMSRTDLPTRQTMADLVHALRQQQERLGKLSDVRDQKLEHFTREDLHIRTTIAEMIGMDDDQLPGDSVFADHLLAAKQALDKSDTDGALTELVMAEEAIHERWKGHPERGAAFIKSTLDRYDWGKRRDLSGYTQAMYHKRLRFEDYFNGDVFMQALSGDLTMQWTVMPTLLVNHVSRLTRMSVADGHRLYAQVMDQQYRQGEVPNAEQRERLLEIWAFLADPDQDITDKLIGATLRPGTPARKEWDNTRIERAMFLNGSQGTGKSSLVRYIVHGYQQQKGRPINVAIVAPGATNSQALVKSIADQNTLAQVRMYTQQDVREGRIGQAFDLLVVDEGQTTDPELAGKYADLMQQYGQAAALFLGDPYQAVSLNHREDLLPLETRMLRTIPLTVSYRHMDAQLLSTLEDLESQVFPNRAQKIVMPAMGITQYTQAADHGVRLLDSNDEVALIDAYKAHVLGEGYDQARIIVLDEQHRQSIIGRLGRDAELMVRLTPEALERSVVTMVPGDHSALGTQTPVVFVAFGPEKLGVDYTRFLFTAVGRAERAATILFPGGRSVLVPTVARIDPDRNAIRASAARELDRMHALSKVIGEPKTKDPKDPDRPGEGLYPFKEPDQDRTVEAKWPVGGTVSLRNGPHGTIEAMGLDPHKHTEGVVVAVEGEESDPRAAMLRFPDGRHTTVPIAFVHPARMTQRKGPEVDDVDPEVDTSAPVEEPVDEQAIKEANEPLLWQSAMAQRHSPSSRIVSAFTPSLPYDERYEQFSLENPAYRLRRALLESIAAAPSGFQVNVVKHVGMKLYNDKGGVWTGDVLALHLVLDTPNMTLVRNAIAKSGAQESGMSLLDDAGWETSTQTMIGVLPTRIFEETRGTSLERDLLMLHAAAAKAEPGVLEDYRALPVRGLEGGRRDANKPNDPWLSYGDLKSKLEKKGFVVGRPRFLPQLWKDKASGLMMPGVVVNVHPFPGSSRVVTRVFLRTSVINDSYVSGVIDELQEQMKATSVQSRLDRTVAEDTRAFHALRWNQARISSDPTLFEGLDKGLVINSDTKSIWFDQSLDHDGRMQALLTSWKAYQQMAKRPGFSHTLQLPVQHVDVRTKEVDLNEWESLYADTQDVRMPSLLVSFDGVATPGTAPADARPRISRSSAKVPLDGGYLQRESIAKAREYVRKVFGDRFVDRQLQFKPRLMDQMGRELWGAMENGYIILEEQAGTVRKGVARHEAVHRVLDLLLDRHSLYEVMDEARDRMRKEKDDRNYRYVKDEEVHEWLANEFEKPSYDSGTLVGRVLTWLRGVLKRWGLYRSAIGNLFTAIENGEYRGVEQASSIDVLRASLKDDLDGDRVPSANSLFNRLPAEQVTDMMSERAAQQRTEAADRSYRDRSVLNIIFGNGVVAANVVHHVARELIQVGPYAQASASTINVLPDDLATAVRKVRGRYLAQAKGIKAFAMVGEEQVPFNDLSGSQVLALDDDTWTDYVTHQLASEDVFRTVVQAVFPRLDVGRVDLNGEIGTDTSAKPLDTDMDALDQLSAMVHDTNDRLDPFERQSALTTLLLDHLPLLEYNDRTGRAQEAATENARYADRDLMRSLLVRSAGRVLSTWQPATDDLYAAFAKDLQSHYLDTPTEAWGAEHRHALAFHRRFLSDREPVISSKGEELYSYRYVVANAGTLLAKATSVAEKGAIIQRAATAEGLLNNVLRTFLEISGSNRMVLEFLPGQGYRDPITNQYVPPRGRFRTRVHHAGNTDSVMRDLEERTGLMYQQVGDAAVKISPEFRGRFSTGHAGDPLRPAFLINSSGVQQSGGQYLLRFVNDRDGVIGQLVDTDTEVLNRFFEAFDHGVGDKALKALLDADKNNPEYGRLARTVSGWAAIAHMAIARENNSVSFGERVVDTEMRRHGGIAFTSTDGFLNRGGSENVQGEDRLPTISALFALNRELVKAESQALGTDHARRWINVGGEVEFVDTLGHALSRLLPVNRDAENASQASKAIIDGIVSRDPLLLGTNPIAGGEVSISDLYLLKGMTRNTGQRVMRGSEVRAWTEQDLAIGTVDLFMDEILNNWHAERLMVPGHIYGDRNALVVFRLDQPAGRARMFSLAGDRVAFNWERAHAWMMQQFSYAQQQQQASQARWAAAVPGQELLTLVRNVDYVIDDQDQLQKGHAFLMDDPIYNATNLERSRIMGVEFTKQLFSREVTRVKQHLFNRVEEGGIGYTWPERLGRNGFDPERDGSELLAGMTVMHHLVDRWTSQMVMGDAARYKNLADFYKRSTLPLSPGHLPVASPSGYGPVIRMAIIDEGVQKATENVLKEPYPELVENLAEHHQRAEDPLKVAAKPFDGQGWTTPWGVIMARVAYGGHEGVFRPAVNKRGYYSNDLQVKYAEAYPSPVYYRSNPEFQQLLSRSLTPDLQAVWDGALQPVMEADNKTFAQAYWDAAQAVIDQARATGQYDQLVHILSSHNNVKMGLTAVNPYVGDQPLVSIPLDIRNLLLQTRLERDPQRLEGPYMTQMAGLMGLMPHNAELAEDLRNTEGALAHLFLQTMKDGIDRQAGDTYEEKADKWMKGIGRAATAHQGDVGQLVDLLQDPDASVNNPILRSRIMQYYSAYVLRRGVHPRMNGQLFSQVSGYGMRFSDSQNIIRGLKPPAVVGGQYSPGEVVMPFTYVQEFGVDPDMTLAEMRMDIADRIGPTALNAFDATLMVFVGRTPTSMPSGGALMRVVGFDNSAGNTIYLPANLNALTGADQDGDQLTVYLPAIQKDKDGIPRVITDPSTVGGLQNKVYDTFVKYYMDGRNAPLTMLPVSSKRLEAIAEATGQSNKLTGVQGSLNDLFQMHQQVFAGSSLIGIVAQSIKGYSYLSQALDVLMLKDPARAEAVFPGWRPVLQDREGKYVIDNLSELLQGALDNVKLLVLGQLGVDPHNVSIVQGALLDGRTLAEAVALARHPAVTQARGIVVRSLSKTRNGRNEQARTLRDALYALDNANKLGEDGQQLLRYVDLNEAVSRLSRIFSMNVKGVPAFDDEWTGTLHDFQFTLNSPLDNVLMDRESDPSYYHQKLEPLQENPERFLKMEGRVRALVDAGGVVSALSNMKAFLQVFQDSDELYSRTLLRRSMVAKLIHGSVLDAMGVNRTLTEEQHEAIMKGMEDFLLSLYLDQAGKGHSLQLTDGLPAIDLGSSHGPERFVREFPGYWQRQIERVATLEEGDPRRQGLVDNTFIQALVRTGRDGVRLEMRDASRYRDPAMRERLRRDFLKVADVFGGDEVTLPAGLGMDDLLALYSTIKDRFSFNRASFTPFLPAEHLNAYDAFLRSLLPVMGSYEDSRRTTYTLNGNGQTVSLYDLLHDRFVNDLLIVHPDLAQWGSEKKPPVFGDYYKTDPRGAQGLVRAEERADQRWRAVRSDLAPRISVSGDNVTTGQVLRTIDNATYMAVLRGDDHIKVPVGRTDPYKMGPVLFSFGAKGVITLVDSQAGHLIVDASENAPLSDVQDDQEPGTFDRLETNGYDRAGGNWFGAENNALHNKSIADALREVSLRSPSKAHRELAGFLYEQGQRMERSGVVTVQDMRARPNGDKPQGRYYVGSGEIILATGLSAMTAETTMLHEALHRYTVRPFTAMDRHLTPAEMAYRSEVQDLYNEVLERYKDVPSHQRPYGLTSPAEFVAEGLASPEFQSQLRNEPWWKRLVNIIKRLLGRMMGNATLGATVIDRLTDITEEYIREATATGRVDSRTGYASYVVMHRDVNDPMRGHGFTEPQPAITDVRDLQAHLLSGKGPFQDYTKLSTDQMVRQLMQRIDRSRKHQYMADVAFDVSGMSDQQVAEYLRKHIVPRIQTAEGERKAGLTRFLNTPGTYTDWTAAFPEDTGSRAMSQENVLLLKERIGFEGDMVFVRYSDLKRPDKRITITESGEVRERSLKEIGLPEHLPGFEGFDPLIGIHYTDDGMEMTLVDVTTGRLGSRGAPGTGPSLFSKYVPSSIQNHVWKLRSQGDVAGARRMILTLQAMALKKANPTLKFRRIVLLGMGHQRMEADSVWMLDQLEELKAVRRMPALYGSLPDTIKAVLEDERLFEGEAYEQSWINQYATFLTDHPFTIQDGMAIGFDHLKLKSELERTLRGMDGTPAGLLVMMRDRLRQLLNTYSDEELVLNKEYRYIARAIKELMQGRRKGLNSSRDTTAIGAALKNTHNVESDLVQWAIRTTINTGSKAAAALLELRKAHNVEMAKLDKVSWIVSPRLGSTQAIDRGYKRFERLWRTRTMKDVHGNTIEAHTSELHHDATDPETAKLLREGKLSRTELDYSNWVLDRIQEAYVRAMVHDAEMTNQYRSAAGTFDHAAAEREAQRRYQDTYRRGWVPVVSKATSELVASLKPGEALKSLVRSSTNVETMFQDDYRGDVDRAMRSVGNRFMGELARKGEEWVVGNQFRLDQLGLHEDALGGLTVVDPAKNRLATKNLESILTYFWMANEHQIAHERESVPVINAASVLLKAMEREDAKSQTNNIAYLERFARRMVFGGNATELDRFKALGVNPAPLGNMLISMTTYGGLALNWRVGLASGLINTLSSSLTAMANKVAGTDDYTIDDLRAGAAAMADPKQRDKACALMQYHFVTEMSEKEVGNNHRYSKTRKLLFSSHVMHYLNWWTDYHTRGAIMVAQMKHDGSWDAYQLDDQGKVTYDVKKDRRFYAADGTKQPDADLMMNEIRRRLINDGIVGQTETGALKAGYDLQMGSKFKWLSDKYIIGGMDPSTQTMLDSWFFGRLITQFRKYLPDKLYNWYGRRIYAEAGGKLVAHTDPFTGERVALWENREIESYLGALTRAYKLMRDSQNFSLKETWGNLDTASRFALVKLAQDLTMFLLMYALYAGLKSMTPDKDELKKKTFTERVLYDNRFQRLVQMGGLDLVTASPPSVVAMFGDYGANPIPAMSTANSIWHVMIGDPHRAKNLIPGRATFELIQQSIAEDN